MSNLSAYINYFRTLAIMHRDIQHNPGSEVGDAPIESKRFSRWNAEEIIRGDLRTKMSFSPAALLLELYETDLQAQQLYDIKQFPKGAFTVLCKAEAQDGADEERALALAEEIVYHLLQQIWQDHYGAGTSFCSSPFHRFWFDKLQITAVGPLYGSCFGFRCEFEFEFQQIAKIIDPPPAGIFNNVYLLGGHGFILADSDETLGT
jgi:hypothetical protein